MAIYIAQRAVRASMHPNSSSALAASDCQSRLRKEAKSWGSLHCFRSEAKCSRQWHVEMGTIMYYAWDLEHSWVLAL